MSPTERHAFIDTYNEHNTEIASQYLRDDRPDLFQVPYKPHTNLRPLNQSLSGKELREIDKAIKTHIKG